MPTSSTGCRKGGKVGDKSFKVHLDGHNLIPFLKGEEKESPREGFMYWSDDGDLMAVRVRQWKVAFLEQNTEIDPKTPLGVWQGEFTKLRAPTGLQPALRSVRARHREHLLWRLVGPPDVPARARAGDRRQGAGELQGVPAARQGGELHRRRRDGEDHDGERESELK